MKPISTFVFFVCLIYANCENTCESTKCISDGLVCQDNGEIRCGNNCKPKYGTSECYECPSISHFYKITTLGEAMSCTLEETCENGYIIDFSKECISIPLSNANNLFLFNNVYYKRCPEYTIQKSSNECKCAYKYYIQSSLYHCLSPTDKCSSHGYTYYDYSTGECTNTCEQSTNYVKIEGDEKRCHSSCIGVEFFYQKLQTDPTTCTDYCDNYIYIDNTNKKNCLGYCLSGYKKNNNYCVPLNECQFYDDTIDHCLNSCDEANSKPYHNFGSNKCINNCNIDSHYYLKNNICYQEDNCNYIQIISGGINRCLSTCNVGEGFIVPDSATPKQCYTSCPSDSGNNYPYYNHGDNKCLVSCSNDGNNKIYHKDGGFECFSSCKDIDDGTLIYAKKNGGGDDYICSSSIPSGCNQYITINNGIKKCEENCPGNYKYLKGEECVEECENYKAIDLTSSQLSKCFLELNDCFNVYNFYNINERTCWKSLPFGYCKKPNNVATSTKFEVIPISDNYYYYGTDEDDKYCVNSCQASNNNKYIDFSDKKKCISECSKGDGANKKYYYYDPRNNECLETCIGSGLEFAEPATATPMPCLIECPSAKSYIDSNNNCKDYDGCAFISEVGKKCLSSCDIGEGFKINGSSDKKCYKTCPNSAQFHDLNNNICFANCGVSTSNKYYINGETVCYSSCSNIPAGPNGKYLYETQIGSGANAYFSCSDIIPSTCNFYFNDNGIKKCKTDCTGYNFIKGKECLNSCDGYKANYRVTTPATAQICLTDLDECFGQNYIYYNTQLKQCWTRSEKPSDYYIKSINFGKYEIVADCSGSLEYEETDGDNNYCYSIEQCKSLGKFKKGNKCVDECTSAADSSLKFIYNSECLLSCVTRQGHDYHNHNDYLCISGCSGDHPYQKENDPNKVCYSSCYNIDNSETYKYLKGFICSNTQCQYFYAIENNVHKCYENEDECINAGYNYLNEKECLVECSNFKVEPVKDSNGIITRLGKCFLNTNKCKENGYYFYNQALKECWHDTCKNGYLIMQLDSFGHPTEVPIEEDSESKETCVLSCPNGYQESDQYCLDKSNCPEFYDEDLEECVPDCGNKYLMRGTNYCNSECSDYYFINNSGKKECLASGENCKSISKFYFLGSHPMKCIDECYISLENGLKKYLFYDSTDNRCTDSCINVSSNNFVNEAITNHQPCKYECDDDNNKYYYENEKICRDTPCILFKDNIENPKICVTECGTGKKVLGNKCVDSCENFFVEQKIEIKGEERIIKKCINDCQEYSSEYKFILHSSNGKECLKSFNEDFIKIGNNCYINNCDKSTDKIFFNPSNQVCDTSCPVNSENNNEYYEKLSDNSDIYICKSSCNLGQFEYEKVEQKIECLSECPQDANYIVDGNKCKSPTNCNKIIKANKGSYLIYECINNNLCSDGQFYSETNNECYSICKGNDEGNPFSLTVESEGAVVKRICSGACDNNNYKYYKEDKICMKEACDGLLVEQGTNRCVESCNEINKFKYESQCLLNCPSEPQFLRYVSPNNECIQHCPEDKRCHPLEGGYECISNCKEGEYKEKIEVVIDTSTNFIEYKCVSDYGESKYYKTDRILINQCNNGDYVVVDTNECVENCDKANTDVKTYYYYEPEQDSTSDNDDYNVKTCILSCKDKKPFYEDGHCKKECRNNQYYKEGDKICLPNCPEGYYKNGNVCVNSCKTKNKFLYTDGTCIDYCPTNDNEYKYYIESDYECIQDCTSENPFYTKTTENIENIGSITKYKCHKECNNYYIVKPNVIAKQCLPPRETCGDYYSNADNEKECYTECPSDKYYDTEKKKCSSQCLENRYHESGSKECKDPKFCSTKFADFDTNECVTQCNTQYYSEIDIGEGQVKTICLNECNEIYGTYITPDNKCVKKCDENFSEKSYEDDNRCKCQHLYYYDEVQKQTICLDSNTNKKEYCYQVGEPYPNLIHIFGTEKCVKTCNYFPSLNGEFCYMYENEACKSNIFDRNSKLMDVENRRKCDCPFKFYIDSEQKKYCLSEFDTCTQEYSFYVPATNQCVNQCSDTVDFTFKFNKYCLSSCPLGSTITGNECKCPNYWYSSGNSFHCLAELALCPDTYKFNAPKTKECLKKCKGSYYPYLFDKNKCYAGCKEISNTMSSIDISNNDDALKKCICEQPWFYTNGGESPINCPVRVEGKKYCSEYHSGKDFMVHDTKECFESCPDEYPYFFNHECFKNCDDDAEKVYHYTTKRESYECQCKNLWYYTDVDEKLKECTTYENMCLGNIENKKYLILNTNQCINSCPSTMYIFNMTCYNKCPDFTVENGEEEGPYTCSCNKDIDAYWYKFVQDGETFYVCGVKECPVSDGDEKHDRPYLLEETKECVRACGDNSKYQFQYNLRKFCVDSCPDNTDSEGFICKFKDINEAEDKEELKDYANVQSKELYERLGHSGGFLYDKFDDVSLQIYEINKDDTLKEISTKSNLTYIDFDTCLPKIYEDNNLKDNENIIVTKYDLKYWVTKRESLRNIDEEDPKTPEQDDKFLINRVEYEFYNSRTMKKIDASVCDPYEILISYPLVFNKNKYDNYNTGFNNNEYKKKLEMGKILHQRNNEYDTFNPNNTLYKEFCTGIELDGKDLVYEDRINVLYPNGALLCEGNCTYNSTDFEEERVNCKCTYKQEIDFERVQEEKNDLINDPNFHVPEQSSSNLEIIKCILKLRIKDAIINNEAFYYCASVAVVALSMVFVTGFYGIKAVGNNISGIMNKFIKKGNNYDVKVFKKNVNKFDSNLNTSNRILSNPPKKVGNNVNNDDENINTGNIIENKDIAFNYDKSNILENENDSKIDDNNDILNIDYNYKAEYLPIQYNFKYFKSTDKGVIKKIERSKLPIKVNQNTKYLLERKTGVKYHDNYLNGPFLSSQNIIEIIDNENDEIIIKNISNEPRNIINTDNDTRSPTKNNESQKKRNLVNNKLNLNMNMSSSKKNAGSDEKEKDFINIKKIKLGKNDNNTADDDYDDEKDDKPDDNAGLYTLIKREQTLLRVSYKKYLSKSHKNILSIFLAEILDKVYLVKICLFLKKYEIFGVHLTLYLFCHLLLLTLCCSFFTISTIKKIWEQDNYPGIQFYLLYGLISYLATWVIYKIFLCLLDMQDKIKELVEMQNKNNDQSNVDENIEEMNNESIQNKFKEVMKNMKCKIIIFYFIIFVFIIVFALYLISFFSIYTGTKSLVLETYIISIIEILLIKLVYGICLASLRIASEGSELKCLYKFVYILDKYLS